LNLTGFDPHEIDDLLALDDETNANTAPPLPDSPVSRLGDRKPRLMVTDPPYGIELDSEWRGRAVAMAERKKD
jgi:hypothetical protein